MFVKKTVHLFCYNENEFLRELSHSNGHKNWIQFLIVVKSTQNRIFTQADTMLLLPNYSKLYPITKQQKKTNFSLSLFFPIQTQGSGLFELRLNKFINDNGKDNLGMCCSGLTDDTGKCIGECNTRFRACLMNYQAKIDVTSKCAFGDVVTPVVGHNNVDFTAQSAQQFMNPFRFPFNFTWPVSFDISFMFSWCFYLCDRYECCNIRTCLTFKLQWISCHSLSAYIVAKKWKEKQPTTRPYIITLKCLYVCVCNVYFYIVICNARKNIFLLKQRYRVFVYDKNRTEHLPFRLFSNEAKGLCVQMRLKSETNSGWKPTGFSYFGQHCTLFGLWFVG